MSHEPHTNRARARALIAVALAAGGVWAGLACGRAPDTSADAAIDAGTADVADSVAPPWPSPSTCAVDLRTVGACPECCLCGGGMATRCDGTTFVPKECHAACGQYLDWVCVDGKGQSWSRCPHDAGADVDATD